VELNTKRLDLEFKGVDVFHRRLYKPLDRENSLVMVDGQLYTRTRDGEPNNPISSHYELNFMGDKPRYIRSDFGDTEITVEFKGEEYFSGLRCSERTDYTTKGTFWVDDKKWLYHSYLELDSKHGTVLVKKISEID